MTTNRRIRSSQTESDLGDGFGSLDEVYTGLMLPFADSLHPQSTAENGQHRTEVDRELRPTLVKRGALTGSGATPGSGIEIGELSIIEARRVATREVPSFSDFEQPSQDTRSSSGQPLAYQYARSFSKS